MAPDEFFGKPFVHPDIGGVGGNENIAQTAMANLLGSIPFAVSGGAYLVESNQGHLGMDMDTSATGYASTTTSGPRICPDRTSPGASRRSSPPG